MLKLVTLPTNTQRLHDLKLTILSKLVQIWFGYFVLVIFDIFILLNYAKFRSTCESMVICAAFNVFVFDKSAPKAYYGLVCTNETKIAEVQVIF